MAILISTAITVLISWFSGLILNLITMIMESFGTEFVENFGGSLNLFRDFFGADLLNNIVQFFTYLGTFLAVVLIFVGIIRNVTSGLGFAGEEPLAMAMRYVGSFIVIYAIQPVLKWVYESIFSGIFKGTADLLKDTNDASWTSYFAGVSLNILYSLVFLFFTIIILKHMIELIVEFVERYLLVGVLIVCAPVVGCAITLKSTMKVFTNYCRMFFSHLLLLIMTSISLTMLISGINYALDQGVNLLGTDASSGFIGQFMPLIMIYAFTRIVARIDNYMRDIGLSIGITGGDMFSDIYSAYKMVSAPGQSVAKGYKSSHGSGSGAKFHEGMASASGGLLGSTSGTFGQRASNAVSRASGGLLDGASKVTDMRKDMNGNTFMKATDKNGNSHLLGLSSEPIKDKDGNILKDANGNPLSKAFQGENGQSYYLTDYSANEMAAKGRHDPDAIADAQRLSNPIAKNFDQMEQVANIGTPRDSNSVSNASDFNSDNGVNFEEAVNGAQINGANAKEFSSMTDGTVDITPNNYNSAVELQNMSEISGGEGYTLHGEGGVASATDVSYANALTSSGIEVTPTNMSAAQSVAGEIISLGEAPSEANISSVMMGNNYSGGAFEPKESMAIGSAIVDSGGTLNAESFNNAAPMAKELISSGYEVTPETMSMAMTGSNYGFTPEQTMAYIQMGSAGTVPLNSSTSLDFANFASQNGLSKEDGIMLAKSIQQARGSDPDVKFVNGKTIEFYNNNKGPDGLVPREKMQNFLFKKKRNKK